MDKRGFTLIELLVVVSIIGLLSSVVVASLNSARDKARLSAAKQFAAQSDRIAGADALGIWEFEECAGGTVKNGVTDISSNISGTASWPANTLSGVGCALFLNGTNNGVTTDVSAASTQGAFTMSAWFNASTVSTGDNQGARRIITRGESGGTRGSISIDADKVCLHVNGGTLFACQPVSVGEWHHVAGVWYPSGSTRWTFYLDGREVGSGSQALTAVTGGEIRIGVGPTGNERYFHGLIDGVRVFDRALISSEVREIYLADVVRRTFAARE